MLSLSHAAAQVRNRLPRVSSSILGMLIIVASTFFGLPTMALCLFLAAKIHPSTSGLLRGMFMLSFQLTIISPYYQTR